MTTPERHELEARLDDLEDDNPTGEPLSLDRVIAACEKGVDPVEKHGGYVPEPVVQVLRELAADDAETTE